MAATIAPTTPATPTAAPLVRAPPLLPPEAPPVEDPEGEEDVPVPDPLDELGLGVEEDEGGTTGVLEELTTGVEGVVAGGVLTVPEGTEEGTSVTDEVPPEDEFKQELSWEV